MAKTATRGALTSKKALELVYHQVSRCSARGSKAAEFGEASADRSEDIGAEAELLPNSGIEQ